MFELKVDFSLDLIINSGQFFNYEKIDGFYYIVLRDRVLKIMQKNFILYFDSNNKKNLVEEVMYFFDFKTDYKAINNELLKLNKDLKDIIEFNKNFRILKMEPFETLISYIISQHNSINNIKKVVKDVSEKYGKKIIYDNFVFYLFPSFNTMKDLSLMEIENLKIGFRSKYIFEVLNNIKNNKLDLNCINDMSSNSAMDYLKLNKGIGNKVASCILTFAYNRFDVFPIDIWVKRIMKDLYNIEKIEEIENFFDHKYSSIIIQYLFNYSRNS